MLVTARAGKILYVVTARISRFVRMWLADDFDYGVHWTNIVVPALIGFVVGDEATVHLSSSHFSAWSSSIDTAVIFSASSEDV